MRCTVGVMGVTGDELLDSSTRIMSGSSLILGISIGSGLSSGKTRVGFGASISQGKMGAGFW